MRERIPAMFNKNIKIFSVGEVINKICFKAGQISKIQNKQGEIVDREYPEEPTHIKMDDHFF